MQPGKKKGSSWISAIKKVFTPKNKPLLNNEEEKILKKENKGVRSRFKNVLFREPSSIEKILGDIDQHHLYIPHLPLPQPQPQPQTQPQPQLQTQPQPQPQLQTQTQTQPQTQPARPASPPRINSPPYTEATLEQQHRSATRIQAAYKAYLARKKVKALTRLVRLQGVVTGQNVKRQTVNAMKQMQLLVRVQTQIQSRRIQNQPQPQTNNKSEMGNEYWDDSLITKEEREARLQKKAEAVIKRERAMAYAYSHQLGKGTPTSTGGYPWWWNWLERSHTDQPIKTSTTPGTPRSMVPQRSATPDHLETPRSMVPQRSTTPPNRMMKYTKGRGSSYPMRDSDSLMSCPAFSVPNYMSPTVSAKAKARPTSNPPSTPGSQSSSKRRFSFPFTPNNSKWKSPRSIGDSSMDSASSLPVSVGRKPFNRFV